MNVAWGKDCKKYQANFTIGYVTEANPSLDLSVSWNKTPLQLMKFHYMMCFLEASVSVLTKCDITKKFFCRISFFL